MAKLSAASKAVSDWLDRQAESDDVFRAVFATLAFAVLIIVVVVVAIAAAAGVMLLVARLAVGVWRFLSP